MSNLPFEEVEHTADWALRVRGSTLKELFANAAHGMYSLTGADPRPGTPVRRRVTLEASDCEALLVEWLNELLYFTESEHEVFDTFEILRLTDTHLEASVGGGPATALNKHIKAATFHDLCIKETEAGYEVTVVFDV